MLQKTSPIIIGFIFPIFGFILCSASSEKADPVLCRTKYPVVFVHGVAFRDKTILANYWGDSADYMKKSGGKAYFGGQDAYGTIPENANALKKRIMEIIDKSDCGKVNIIAHSRGGLE